MSNVASTQTAQLLDANRAAEILNMSPKTLANWRSLSRGPKFVKNGRLVRYTQADLDEYVRQNIHQSTLAYRFSEVKSFRLERQSNK